MGAYIFLCDFTTERECLERKLFGTNPGEMHQHHYSKIAVGDMLFLYNFETGMLRGPFTATTPCKLNIEPTAWKKTRRSFPWQVRVDDGKVFKTALGADELRKHVTLASTKMGLLPPAELTDEQQANLLFALEQTNGN
jgi:hypothetical protein